MQGLPSILFLFHNLFNEFNNTGAQMLDCINDRHNMAFSVGCLKKILITMPVLAPTYVANEDICI